FPRRVIVFDHYHSTLKIIVNTLVNSNSAEVYRLAEEKIESLIEIIRENNVNDRLRSEKKLFSPNPVAVGSSLGRAEFCKKVEIIKEHIRSGDILQAVLSQRFEKETGAVPFEVYRALRSLNPSPYMYYLHFDEVKVAGASPEMLVRLEGRVIENRPIAGTRPRGRTEEEDRQLEAELLNDPKERAEHVMLVDLGRNDVGRVSCYGSVEVPVFMACERYSHVMHLVSEVRGKLAEGRDALDALAACFPAGTVSGAPKIRAMKIIDELEPVRRGPYAGAVGYFSYAGDMDTCITIRTIVFAKGKAYAQAGAGIVADSRPDSEYEETFNKARVLIKALQIAEEGQL
ncbi:MAG TPA: anthranilate synthase component I family protein, partial [Firmicutes bacterium]|nr:anthranilate synthase component I family protein [Bacillota bacterium]